MMSMSMHSVALGPASAAAAAAATATAATATAATAAQVAEIETAAAERMEAYMISRRFAARMILDKRYRDLYALICNSPSIRVPATVPPLKRVVGFEVAID